jgi:hypothetical protein
VVAIVRHVRRLPARLPARPLGAAGIVLKHVANNSREQRITDRCAGDRHPCRIPTACLNTATSTCTHYPLETSKRQLLAAGGRPIKCGHAVRVQLRVQLRVESGL